MVLVVWAQVNDVLVVLVVAQVQAVARARVLMVMMA